MKRAASVQVFALENLFDILKLLIKGVLLIPKCPKAPR